MDFELNDWLSQDSIKDITKLSKDFNSNNPFPYLEIESFFHDEICEELIDSLCDEEFTLKESDLFKFQQSGDLNFSNDKLILGLRDFLKSKAFLDLMTKITNLKFKENQVDLHSTIYGDTDFLICHDDKLDSRNLAFLLYLSDFERSDGGSLNLLDSTPKEVVKKIIPKFNKFVIFKVSEISFHEVEEVLTDNQRIAMGGWLHEG